MTIHDTNEDSGYITINGKELPASLSLRSDGSVRLEVTDRDADFGPSLPERIDLALFRGGRRFVSLLDLHQMGFKTRFGVGARVSFVCRWSLEDVHLDDVKEAACNKWVIGIHSLDKVFRVNGLQHTIERDGNGNQSYGWKYSLPDPAVINCIKAGVKLSFCQSVTQNRLEEEGAHIKLGYPLIVETENQIDLGKAQALFYRLRAFFSICYGKELGLKRISFRIEGIENAINVQGFQRLDLAEFPIHPLVNPSADQLAESIDQWLVNFDKVADAVHLQLQGLTQKIVPSLRFLTFMQAIESLHRKTVQLPPSAPVDFAPIEASLQDNKVSPDVIARIKGMLSMSSDPGLRKRLKDYVKQFQSELVGLSDSKKRARFIQATVSTRNHFVHRLEPDKHVLSGSDLWNATETLKAITHLAIMAEVGIPTAGVGQRMLSGFISRAT